MEVIAGIEVHARQTGVLAGSMERSHELSRGVVDIDFILLRILQGPIAGSDIDIADLSRSLSAHKSGDRKNQGKRHYSSKSEFHRTPPTWVLHQCDSVGENVPRDRGRQLPQLAVTVTQFAFAHLDMCKPRAKASRIGLPGLGVAHGLKWRVFNCLRAGRLRYFLPLIESRKGHASVDVTNLSHSGRREWRLGK